MRTVVGQLAGLAAALVLVLSLGCATRIVPTQTFHYRYFDAPAPGDIWTAKITGWQVRARAEAHGGSVPAVAGPAQPSTAAAPSAGRMTSGQAAPDQALRSKYDQFRAERRRTMAREFAEWIQGQALDHYVADGPVDHWATLEETLQRDGDDCDGLELLTYNGLIDLGFSSDRVFRSIVYRPSDGQHHMVTLWFEDPHDPWVIDPTGAMTTGMPRMSDMPSWIPLKVFGESAEYSVRVEAGPKPTATLVSN